MSLFQMREWWTMKLGSGEDFTSGSMAVANIDNAPGGEAKIVTGSLQGKLRVHQPDRYPDPERGSDDLLVEQQLDAPVLQLAVGRAVPHDPSRNALIILHPRKLMVCTVDCSGDGSEQYHQLTTQYVHKLGVDGEHFTAFNMVVGPFGRTGRKDLICVQSMDGRLQVFDQDAVSFSRRLPGVLLPGPLCYVPPTDAFVTGTSDLRVEAYRYQILVSATDEKKKAGVGDTRDAVHGAASGESDKATSVAGSRKLQPDWSVHLGEPATHVSYAKLSYKLERAQFDVIVVGEHTLFFLKEQQGTIRMQKRLEFKVGAVCTYPRPSPVEGAADALVLGSTGAHLLVYQELRLCWSARTLTPQVALAVAKVGAHAGMVCGLDAAGHLSVQYLGTDPPSQAVATHEAKALDFAAITAEHTRLLGIIRASQSETTAEPWERLILRPQVPKVLDEPSHVLPDDFAPAHLAKLPASQGGGDGGGYAALTVRLFVSYTGNGGVRDVSVTLDVPDCARCPDASFVVPSVQGATATPHVLPITFYVQTKCIPMSTTVSAVATYTTESGEPRTSRVSFALPLACVGRLIPAIKSSTFKLTVDTNKGPVPLRPLFEDMFSQPGVNEVVVGGGASVNTVLSFQYWYSDPTLEPGAGTPIDATILVSKNGGRYRIQSSSLPALWTITNELCTRLQEHWSRNAGGGDDGAPLEISYTEPLPLQDFYNAIDQHFERRLELRSALSALNDCAHQFRIIEKRLLVRFKDRNPAPLAQLDALMHETYQQVLTLAGRAERAQEMLKVAANALSCVTRLILTLVRYRFGLDAENFALLQSYFALSCMDADDESGWEETVDAAMTHLLKTSLAKTAKESTGQTATATTLQMPADTQKLKKHISMVCDRLSKGARLNTEPPKGRAASGDGAPAAGGGGADDPTMA